MKNFKFLLIGLLMLAAAPAMAQDDNKAAIDAAAAIINSKPADLDDQLKPIYKKNRKNPEVLVGIGQAFLEAEDAANATVYCDYAIKADKEYAPAYILQGDIAAFEGDGGRAAQSYNQAIYFDPKNPDGYYKYASVYRKISPSEAVGRLEELRAQRPDVAVDALIAHIYYISGDLDNAAKSYAKVDRALLSEKDLVEYTMTLYLSQKYKESLELAKAGLAKMPRDAAFNRLAFFNSTELKNYDAALQYADALFNKSDSAKITYFDYTYYGNAYSGMGQNDKAIEMYNKALNEEIDDKDKRAGVIKQLSDTYRSMKDYDNAIKYYQQFLGTVSSTSANDMAALAQIYTQYADSLSRDTANSAKKLEYFKKADDVYVSLDQKYPNAHEYVLFMRARLNSYMDPESSEGLAKPHYEELVSIIEPRAEKSSTDLNRLMESYRYLGYYYLVKDDRENSNVYWQKILEIDPNNEQAKAVLSLK